MWFTLLILGFLAIGVIAGLIFRKKKIRGLSHTTMWLICLLLFMLGMEIGNNREALSRLDELGMTALIFTIGSVVGSLLLSWLLWRYMNRKKGGKTKGEKADVHLSAQSKDKE